MSNLILHQFAEQTLRSLAELLAPLLTQRMFFNVSLVGVLLAGMEFYFPPFAKRLNRWVSHYANRMMLAALISVVLVVISIGCVPLLVQLAGDNPLSFGRWWTAVLNVVDRVQLPLAWFVVGTFAVLLGWSAVKVAETVGNRNLVGGIGIILALIGLYYDSAEEYGTDGLYIVMGFVVVYLLMYLGAWAQQLKKDRQAQLAERGFSTVQRPTKNLWSKRFYRPPLDRSD